MHMIIKKSLFLLFLVSQSIACQADKNINLDYLANDFRQHMSQNWGNYKITEYFSKTREEHNYLADTFIKFVLSDAVSFSSKQLNIAELIDTEGGFDLGLLKITYSSSDVSKKNFDAILLSKNKNLKGSKVFIGYTAIRCEKDVVIISSPAVVTREIKEYFLHVNNTSGLCR